MPAVIVDNIANATFNSLLSQSVQSTDALSGCFNAYLLKSTPHNFPKV